MTGFPVLSLVERHVFEVFRRFLSSVVKLDSRIVSVGVLQETHGPDSTGRPLYKSLLTVLWPFIAV